MAVYNNITIFVCGSRKEVYKDKVYEELSLICQYFDELGKSYTIIEGCCPNSADKYTEEFCKEFSIKNEHFPGKTGYYLNRNIEMAKKCDICVAFWDGFSYGTAHSIAQCVKLNKKVKIINI